MSEKIRLKDASQILAEIRELKRQRLAHIKSRIAPLRDTQALFLNQPPGTELSPAAWVLRAQIGTLDKIERMFQNEEVHFDIGLIATIRNLFENLVWIKLFSLDVRYGLVCYGHYLFQQTQVIKALIEKLKREVILFDKIDKDERHETDRILREASTTGHNSLADQELSRRMVAVENSVDDDARREFALYAAAAKWNSYAYQSVILTTQVIPTHMKDLKYVEDLLENFNAAKLGLLDEPLVRLTNPQNWKWRSMAALVQMADQYDFIYSYTSKLLHSTALNLLTEKALSDDEALMMLEYAFISIRDIFDLIEGNSVAGTITMIEVS